LNSSEFVQQKFAEFGAAFAQLSAGGISEICASAIAQPTGWPRNVLVWIASPVEAGHAASIKSARPTQAESGKPPVKRLAEADQIGNHAAECSHANHFPVRPKPV
jgi:hypothetical protein